MASDHLFTLDLGLEHRCESAGIGCAPNTSTPRSGEPQAAHQPGVSTVPPARGLFAAIDLLLSGVGALQELLRQLSAEIMRLPGVEVTVAVGASLFDGRFGLATFRPRHLTMMPRWPNDLLDPRQCHGDLLLQICGASDAASVLTQLTLPGMRIRWVIGGFREQDTADAQGRPSDRNLFGFREGAGNLDITDPVQMNDFVWVGRDDPEPAWAQGGTYQVVRIIQLSNELWSDEPLERQQAVFGRRKVDGAPLGYQHEDDPIDYSSDPDGQVIALDAHIRRANPRTPETRGNRILRRGYSYRRAGQVPGAGDEGLVFVCFQRDLEQGFNTIQRRLAGEALGRYILPVGGGYFFVLPGADPADSTDFVGKRLLTTGQQGS